MNDAKLEVPKSVKNPIIKVSITRGPVTPLQKQNGKTFWERLISAAKGDSNHV